MKYLDLKQKLFLAGWLLSAALLLWVNGYSFLALEEDASLDSDPANVRLLRSQLAILENLSAAGGRELTDMAALQGFFAAYRVPGASAPATATIAAAAEADSENGLASPLPGLAGVLQKVNARGLPYYLALLDGRVCAEKDEVGGFMVGAISAEGVVLQRSGMRWFLPSPQPYYNSDQGR